MKLRMFPFFAGLVLAAGLATANEDAVRTFDPEKDILSLHYDHAPDKDDGHSAAADRTVLESMYNRDWIKSHVVAVSGTYGRNSGGFNTNSDAVMDAAWNDCGGWLAARVNREQAVTNLAARWSAILSAGGDVWVKEGGQSDVTAEVLKKIIAQSPGVDTAKRVHVVQHSKWNEQQTGDDALAYTRKQTHYIRIRDANAYLNIKGGNADFEKAARAHKVFGPAWTAAFAYYDPKHRLDFSDTGELLHILGLGEIRIDKFRERFLGTNSVPARGAEDKAVARARESAKIAGYSLSKVQRWLHEVALKKIDPGTGLYISHTSGSGRYRESLWNYDDTAADTYPYLFWAAWYTDRDQVNGPILGVLEAEQRICNYLDRIPTAVNHKTLEKTVKSRDDLIFAASEYLKDGLVAIVEVAGKDNPWAKRMCGIEEDIWKHADIDTPYGKIPTLNLEANGDQIQVLARLFTMTGEKKYLEWAERLADYYLLKGGFVPDRLRDHGCEIIGGLGLLLGVESEHNPGKAAQYLPHIRHMLDEILARGINEDGLMYNKIGAKDGLSDGWGYNYVTYLCHDMAAGKPVYTARIEQTLRNLAKPLYRNYNWEGNIDGFADSIEGAIYLVNRVQVDEALAWVEREMAANVILSGEPLETAKLWTTYKLDSNAVRTTLQHAMMHTRGLIACPWRQDLALGAAETKDGLAVVMNARKDWSGKLVFDIPRHRIYMGFKHDWPRINSMPEWFTVEPDRKYVVENTADGSRETCTGKQLHEGLPVVLKAGEERLLLIK